jgi:hypothetical protein
MIRLVATLAVLAAGAAPAAAQSLSLGPIQEEEEAGRVWVKGGIDVTYFEVEKPEIDDAYGFSVIGQVGGWGPLRYEFVELGVHHFESEAKGLSDASGFEPKEAFECSIWIAGIGVGTTSLMGGETGFTLSFGYAGFRSREFDKGQHKGGGYVAVTARRRVHGPLELVARLSLILPEGDAAVRTEDFDLITATSIGLELSF